MTRRFMGRLRTIVAPAFACVILAGCGSATYEAGLKETEKYFRYLDTLNRNLERDAWKGSGVEIRMPAQFQVIPGPAAPAPSNNAEGESEDTPPPVDPRQPKYVNGELPGLVAAFKKMVKTRNRDSTVPCDIFILSDSGQFQRSGVAGAGTTFIDYSINQLVDGLEIEEDDREKLEWPTERIPRNRGYVTGNTLRTETLHPQKMINGNKNDVIVYYTQNQKSKIDVFIVFVVPAGVDTSEKMHDRIALSLETLKISNTKPLPAGTSRPKTIGGF